MPVPAIAVAAGISAGASLLGSLFGRNRAPRVPRETEEARRRLLEFAEQGFPPELLAQIERAQLGNIAGATQQAQEGIRARGAASGLRPGSGLLESRQAAVTRSGQQARGGVAQNVQLQEFMAQLQALRSLSGLPQEQQGQGLGPFESIAGISANLLPLLALQQGNKPTQQQQPQRQRLLQ